MPAAIVARSDGVYTAKMPVVVTGVIGSDTHIVGNRILSMALEKAGYKVVIARRAYAGRRLHQGGDRDGADAILVSSLYGQGELDCRGFRDLCVEAGLEDILLYVGGNLVVGKRNWPETRRRFLDMGFDRALRPGTRTRDVLRVARTRISLIASAGMRTAGDVARPCRRTPHRLRQRPTPSCAPIDLAEAHPRLTARARPPSRPMSSSASTRAPADLERSSADCLPSSTGSPRLRLREACAW